MKSHDDCNPFSSLNRLAEPHSFIIETHKAGTRHRWTSVPLPAESLAAAWGPEDAELQLGLPKLEIDHSKGVCWVGEPQDEMSEAEALGAIKISFDEELRALGGVTSCPHTWETETWRCASVSFHIGLFGFSASGLNPSFSGFLWLSRRAPYCERSHIQPWACRGLSARSGGGRNQPSGWPVFIYFYPSGANMVLGFLIITVVFVVVVVAAALLWPINVR